MDKVEKLEATIAGRDIGVVPYSFWSHFPGVDQDPIALAEHTYEFYRTYDIDFIKTSPNGMYSVEDFGCVCDFSEIERGGVAKIVRYAVESPADWARIGRLDCEKGALGRELRSLRRLVELMRGEAPVIATVFSPLTTAAKLSNKKIYEHIASGHADVVHQALTAIAETTAAFCEKAIAIGVSGVFLATQSASRGALGEAAYREFGARHDFEALAGASKGWFNAVHIHGNDIMFEQFLDYPVHVINWHIGETSPGIAEARKASGKCFMGGLNRMDITKGDRGRLAAQIRASVEESGGKGLILTPGCGIRHPLNDEVLNFVKAQIDSANAGLPKVPVR